MHSKKPIPPVGCVLLKTSVAVDKGSYPADQLLPIIVQDPPAMLRHAGIEDIFSRIENGINLPVKGTNPGWDRFDKECGAPPEMLFLACRFFTFCRIMSFSDIWIPSNLAVPVGHHLAL